MSKCSSSKAELPAFKSQPTAYLLCHSVHFSCSVMSDPLGPHELQHAGFPVHHQLPDLSLWCHPTISSSVVPFSCLQSFSPSGSSPVSQLFASGSQNIGVSASASVLQDGFPLGNFLVWSPCSPRDSQESSPTPQLKSINSSALIGCVNFSHKTLHGLFFSFDAKKQYPFPPLPLPLPPECSCAIRCSYNSAFMSPLWKDAKSTLTDNYRGKYFSSVKRKHAIVLRVQRCLCVKLEVCTLTRP